jgi:AraC family transcriptional regulator, transcriptional activator of pobA
MAKTESNSIEKISCARLNNTSQHFALYAIQDFLPMAQELSHLHRHNYYMLLFNEKGNGKHIIDFNTYDIEPLSITCMHPGQLHQWLEYQNLQGYLIFFEKEFYALRYQTHQLNQFHFFSYRHESSYVITSQDAFLKCLTEIRLMENEYKTKLPDFEKSLRSYLNILLIEIKRLFLPAMINNVRSQSIELISHFEDLIEQNFRKLHLVKDYALLLYVRPNYLNSVCMAVTGNSAGELIRNRILIEAKRILVHEPKTISELSYYLGFEDNSYFGRFFKKYVHCSPDKFKKQGTSL